MQLATRTLALSPDEPAGRISTRTPGVIEVLATLRWQTGPLPRKPMLLELPNDGRARCTVAEVDDEVSISRTITGEIRAFDETDLRLAQGAFLRSIGKVAALSEAALEARAVYLASPAVTPVAVLETLAIDLRDAGFPVTFGRSWSPAPNAAVGTGGAEPDLVEFLRGHPAWEILA